MGIDVLGWFGCPRAVAGTPEELLQWMKLSAYKAAAEREAPEHLASLVISMPSHDGVQRVSYQELAAGLEALASQAGECRDCFVSGPDSPCYAYISYPIDAECEEVLFRYFTSAAEALNSPANQILRDVVLDREHNEEYWAAARREPDRLLKRDAPLKATIGGYDDVSISSTEVLDAVTSNVSGVETVSAYGLFWNHFNAYISRYAPHTRSKGIREMSRLAEIFKTTLARSVAGSQFCQVLFYP